jgi:WD40 repeat protein
MFPFGYEGRSAIASLASFGSSFVATGGVDGSVFLARLRFFDSSRSTSKKQSNTSPSIVHGVRVECGKDNGAVTCLAAAKGVGYKQASSQTFSDEEESFSSLEGCRIVGGTTGGALRVWCVKDIYATTSLAGNMSDVSDLPSTEIIQGVDRDAQYIRSGQQSIANKLKWSLKGRALSGHRGGVTCLDVPSPIYRPETLLSGGADGLIKLWSLRHVTRRSARTGSESTTSRFLGRSDADKRASSNDAQETLSGHAGRVMCIKTAWHGDGMLSGGADRSVRLWDISTTGKCVSSFQGHSCWVTQTHFWGQNNIVSASTDRSIALWDARNGALPLFIIRYHKSPVSDVLIGSRNDPLLVSASGDGTIATWDFRSLSSSSDPKCSLKSRVHSIRIPAAAMNHRLDLTSNTCCGAIFLARGTGLYERSVISASIDGHVKEWDIQTGKLYYDQFTKHTDAISCLSTFTESDGLRRGKAGSASSVGGTITCAWDGTVRLKSLLLRRTSDG